MFFHRSVSPNVTDSYAVPEVCGAAASGCVAAGCIEAVNPEFYQFPSRSTCPVVEHEGCVVEPPMTSQ